MATATPSPCSREPASIPPAEPGAGMSQGVRTTINFLIFVHLFSLGVMFLFNGSEMGLRPQLRRVPGYYLQLLGMDLDFESGQRANWQLQSRDTRQQYIRLRDHLTSTRYYEAEKELTALLESQKQNPRLMHRRGLYHLTHADVLDVGHVVEFRYTHEGREHVLGLPAFRRGSSGGDVLAAWPSSVKWQGFWPRQRYLRYQTLTREIGRLTSLESVQDILPAAITEGLLRSEGIDLKELAALNPRLYCYRLTTRDMLQAAAAREPTAEDWVKDPWHERWFQPAYQKVPIAVAGRVLFNDISGLQRDYSPKVEEAR